MGVTRRPSVASGGRRFQSLGVAPFVGTGRRRVRNVRPGCAVGDGGGDEVCPRCPCRDMQKDAPAGAGQGRRDGEQAQPQPFRFPPAGVVTGQCEVCIHAVRSMARATTAVLTSCPSAVAQPEVGQLSTWSAGGSVGGEGGDPDAVDVVESQLCAGVGPFLTGDDPHAGGPGRQVQQVGQLRDPGAVTDLVLGVVRRRPHPLRDAPQQVRGGVPGGEPEPSRTAAARSASPRRRGWRRRRRCG